MKHYVVMNVQGLHDLTVKVFTKEDDLKLYLEDFFVYEDYYSVDSVFPTGEVYFSDSMLKVIEVGE